MSQWVRVATVAEIPAGTGKEVIAEGHVIALYHQAGEFHALDGVCPHAGGPLAKGRLDGCIVTCPWHGWQFDIQTGQHCLTASLKQPAFAVKVEGSEVWVEIP